MLVVQPYSGAPARSPALAADKHCRHCLQPVLRSSVKLTFTCAVNIPPSFPFTWGHLMVVYRFIRCLEQIASSLPMGAVVIVILSALSPKSTVLP